MKFDVLHDFRAQLNQEDLAENTKKQYYNFVKKVLADIDFNEPGEIPQNVILQGMKKLKTKNDVSAAKRGFEYFKIYYPELRLPEQIGQISKTKRNFKKRKWQPLKLDKLKRTINSLQDKKLKYAYRLMLATGMRVSEVEQISKQDITIAEDEIKLHIEHTKSGCPATVSCKDPYLLEKLPGYLAELKQEDKAFYSASKMMQAANAYGFECHDLRRVFAKLKYREIKPVVGSSYRAVGEVRELMRHESCRTTKIYLRRKII